ncbi:MAG: hypothetical protein KKA65_00800, partial [Nanoarchaeota archaeon]|nr:hypothetical protein [Nanoarchaeota archaeon]
MSFIKEIFEGKANDSIHYKFVRYGKGEYERLLFEITKSKNNFRVKSSFDFANDFIKIIENINKTIQSNINYLSELDSTVGDGDHGI